MYAEFHAICKMMHDIEGADPKYVGLPANQIMHVAQKFGNIVACEKNPHNDRFMHDLMNNIVNAFSLEKSVKIVNEELTEYLQHCDEQFTIYDADLMTYANKPGLIDALGNGISRTMGDFAVICVVTCSGRHITDEEYKSIMPVELVESISKRVPIDIVYLNSDRYQDSVTPMRYEILAVRRK